MKKVIALFLSFGMLVCACTGCIRHSDISKSSKLSIVTTIFPEYDWVRQIVGDQIQNINLTLLMNNGVDIHNYQPTADDIVTISACDILLYVGGESDEWIEDVLAKASNKKMIVINLLDELDDAVKEEELVEGMKPEEVEYDEHVWLSLKNAAVCCRIISQKLCKIDKKNQEVYTRNADDYIQKLEKLDAEYQSAVNAASVKTLLFGDRFPFRYLAEDYDLSYYAAFLGCSAETEASFQTIVFLANKVDELGLKAILQIESADGLIAKTIKQNTKAKNQTILTMNSLQSVTAKEISDGITYLSAMESNLLVLKNALQ